MINMSDVSLKEYLRVLRGKGEVLYAMTFEIQLTVKNF